MASANPSNTSNKKTSNYAQLCRLLVEVGSHVLRDIFDNVCPPENLHAVLTDPKNHAKLQTLQKKRVLSPSQWRKLYPLVKSSSVSSGNFDTSLLLLLLRNICAVTLPASGLNSLPPASDVSPGADIARIKFFRDRVFSYDTDASVDDPTFSLYWNNIKDTFLRIGGTYYEEVIDDPTLHCMDADLEEYYRDQLREWLKDEDCIADKLQEDETVQKARMEEDVEGAFNISEQKLGMEEAEVNCAENGSAVKANVSSPELSIKIPKICDLPESFSAWNNVVLPVDILLLTVEDFEFLGCFAYLKEPFKSYHKSIGYVYFGYMGDDQGNKMEIALMRCSKGSDVPGGSLSAAKDAISLLRPKATFSVGACSGLNSREVKLGDVVVSAKLITAAHKTIPGRDIGNLIKHVADGWKAPLQNAGRYNAKVHGDGVVLSISEANKDIISQHPEAIAVEMEGGGVFAAAHNLKTEWVVVKGIKDFLDDRQSSSEEWERIACVMAASVVANILNNPVIFQDWPHFKAETCGSRLSQEPPQVPVVKSSREPQQPDGRSGNKNSEQLQIFIVKTKEKIKKDTHSLTELRLPFSGPPGEQTAAKDLTLDQIYTNLVVIPGRARYRFTTDRQEQLKVYPMSRYEESQLKSLKDLLNDEIKKVLIVGRPGIGKTLCCTKILRDWAFDKVFNAAPGAKIHFDAAFLVKFRRFNSSKDLNLRELLIMSEHSPSNQLDDEVWKYILQHSENVLIVFDGFDEFNYGANMAVLEPPFPSIEDKMPLEILYQLLVKGELFEHASVVTTTRPTALKGIGHLKFDKTLEILGFSTEQIEEYVYKFAGDDKQTGEILWRHISSNMNLLSLCYIPVNSFIICSSLSQILQFEGSASVTLPSKLTTIYKIGVKVFYLKHTKEFRDKRLTREDFVSDNLPTIVRDEFETLGRVAFEGIKEGKLILEGKEVGGMEDSALFHRLPDRQSEAFKFIPQFCFIHLTMQEFFAARHLATTMKESELTEFVSENIEDGKWQLVFQFLAGLMNDKEKLPSEIITNLLPVETKKEPIEGSFELLFGDDTLRKGTEWPTKGKRNLAVTLFKCFNESERMQSIVQRKLQQINFNCLNFITSHLTAVDCSSLVNVIMDVEQITHLELSGNNLGPLGCFEICKLLKCRKSELSWLNLAANQLKDEGAKYLADAITNNNCKLHTLYLYGNDIKATGAKHLAEAITNINCQLHTLYFAQNNITDTGAQHLAEAITNINCQLHRLFLSNNDITDTGAQHLAEAITNINCQLHKLDLSRNHITHTGEQDARNLVRKSQPKCKLIF